MKRIIKKNNFEQFLKPQKVNTKILTWIVLAVIIASCQTQTKKCDSLFSGREKTCFQTSGPWKPVTDVQSDVAIVYGANDRRGITFEEQFI